MRRPGAGHVGQDRRVRGQAERGGARGRVHKSGGSGERAEVEAVIAYLPNWLRDFTRFAYLTGWRKGEIQSLKWTDIDMDARVIRLRPEHSKNSHSRVVAMEGELLELMQRRCAARLVETLRGPKIVHWCSI